MILVDDNADSIKYNYPFAVKIDPFEGNQQDVHLKTTFQTILKFYRWQMIFIQTQYSYFDLIMLSILPWFFTNHTCFNLANKYLNYFGNCQNNLLNSREQITK